MFRELHYDFNGMIFNKIVYDAGYDGIKDFAERSGINISYSTIKRACDDGHCTKRTLYAIACKLAEALGWAGDPIAALKNLFTKEKEHEYKELLKESDLKYKEECGKKLEQCIVYLSDGRETLVQGKSIYWSWFVSENTICFYDEDGCDDDLKIAEFNKACVIGIVRIIEE